MSETSTTTQTSAENGTEPEVVEAEGVENAAAESAIDESAGEVTEGTASTDAQADSGAEGAAEGESQDGEADGDADGDGEGTSDPLEVEGEIAADYLEELLDIADLDGDIDTYVESGRAHVSIVTETDVLVGKDGVVLEALQELARLAVVTETGHRSRLMLDVAGHRDQRRNELVAVATDAIAEAKSSNGRVRLAPMNAFERKIVHDAVAAAGLTSESEGEEPQRRVVIVPA